MLITNTQVYNNDLLKAFSYIYIYISPPGSRDNKVKKRIIYVNSSCHVSVPKRATAEECDSFFSLLAWSIQTIPTIAWLSIYRCDLSIADYLFQSLL